MQLTHTASSVSIPAPGAGTARPPQRWARWWTSPIARVDYGAGSATSIWHEAQIPATRGITGALQPELRFGGPTAEQAVAAARKLANVLVDIAIDTPLGTQTVQVHPAIAVLRDARAGVFWLAPLRTTLRSGGEWVEAPHSIDGPAFDGPEPVLRAPRIKSVTSDMVAVVGGTRVTKPRAWPDAPPDSRIAVR